MAISSLDGVKPKVSVVISVKVKRVKRFPMGSMLVLDGVPFGALGDFL
jgi:hypothetical protein